MTDTATSTVPVFLDCDTGIDDALALAYLLAAPNADLVGVGTVHGNTSAASGAENTRRLLAMTSRGDIPVAVGASDPLVGTFAGGTVAVHGEDGVGGVRERLLPEVQANAAVASDTDAVDLLIRLSHEHDGELHLIAIGPLTNLAIALERDPSLITRVAQVTIMGGAAMVPGNITAAAEANIVNDPEAAERVLSAGWPVTLVPLDTTMENAFEKSHIDALTESDSPLISAVGEMLHFYSAFYTDIYGRVCCALHDPLAAAIDLGEVEIASGPRVPVVVDDTYGPGRGQTICDLRHQRPANGEYDIDVDGATVRVVLRSAEGFPDLLAERLLGWAARQ
ncbi:MAG TPA: nucleoside hydrolase [Candidatus Corynebacterium avicola]|uniref:Nucleoside hydrolase n=1 Tax=Candidatus Corynebacterium avicola TaxID=2838527 RepID=A0A9D1UKL9_9CORY|nr:nucleoside hydrolase [Candidatus Corynebacterium avicola]